MRTLKIAALSLSALAMNAGCIPGLQDNFWGDRWNSLLASAIDIGVKMINGALSVNWNF